MMPTFKHSRTQSIDWENLHGTFKKKGVTRILPIASTGNTLDRWRRVGEVLKDVVGQAFTASEPLRPDGSRWSLSKIAVPSKWALSLAAHDVLEQVPEPWVSAPYRTTLTQTKLTPMLISGSMKIQRINRFLAMRDLALQTSGASDGQTLAGASTTGTHGAAIKLGALHDTFRAIHLMVGPNQAVLVQPKSAPLLQAAATDLTSWLGVTTTVLSDDEAFQAALVGLGSMGIVIGVVVEVEPLYALTSVTTPHVKDEEWKKVLRTMSAVHINGHPSDPWHLEVLLTAYPQKPKSAPRAWVKTMVKAPYESQPDVETDPSHPTRPSPDLIGFVVKLAQVADLGILNPTFRARATKEMVERYGHKKVTRKALPGVIFGPTAVPVGQGHSVEYVVAGTDALIAVEALLGALASELKKGRQFLGAIGVRFVGQSVGSLAPNTKAPSCFIELPGVRTKELEKIYDACAAALSDKKIPFGCHWGQYLVGTKASLKSYFGPVQVTSWTEGRKRILKTDLARTVFASPILGPAGLK